MAITRGVLAASATGATDLRDLIETCLSDAGWQDLGQKTAATMGTTEAVDVWASPTTTEVSTDVWEGCILYIEADNTNQRIRYRVSEMFDDAATGSPATNVKRAVPGCHQAQTPTAAATFSESYVALFQAAGTSQSVAWVQVAVPTGVAHVYWIGANDRRFFHFTNYTNQSTNSASFMMAGHLESLHAAVTTTVFLLANDRTTSSTIGSWTKGQGSGSAIGNARMSREAGRASTSTNGAFTASTGGVHGVWPVTRVPGGWGGATQAPTVLAGPPLLMCYLHGTMSLAAAVPEEMAASTTAATGFRSHHGYIPDLYIQCAANDSYSLLAGSTVSGGGMDFLSVGMVFLGNVAEDQAGFVVDGNF